MHPNLKVEDYWDLVPLNKALSAIDQGREAAGDAEK